MNHLKVEVLQDPLQYMIEDGLLMEERHEILPDSEWIRAVRRATGRKDLFVYRHRESNRFMLSQWLHRREPAVCKEIMGMDEAPDRGGWIALRIVELQCRPAFILAREMRTAVQADRSQRDKQRGDRHMQQRDVARHLQLQGKDTAAASVLSGPYTGEGESTGELAEELVSAAKGKVITHA